MDFIFMLTNKDRTVANCLDVMAEIADLGLTHVGFKDVGVDLATLKQLAAAIRKSGATSYVEVVSTTPETIRRSIAAAAELGRRSRLGRAGHHLRTDQSDGAGHRLLSLSRAPAGPSDETWRKPEGDRGRLHQGDATGLPGRRSPRLSRDRRRSLEAHSRGAARAWPGGLSDRRRKHRFAGAHSRRRGCGCRCLHHRLGDFRGRLCARRQRRQGQCEAVVKALGQ